MVPVGVMRKLLTLLNKGLRQEYIIKGLAKLPKKDIERHFRQRFEHRMHRKDDFIYYVPDYRYDDTTDSEEYEKIMRDHAPKKSAPKKSAPKKSAPKKSAPNLINEIEDFVKKYNANEIKKLNLTKENFKPITDKFFDTLEKIQKKLDDIDDPIKFFKDNKDLSTKFADIKKNYVRRVRAQFKKSKK